MEKDTIETNDLRFRQQVEKLCTHLASRQRTYARQRKGGLYLTVLGSLVMVTAVGAYFLGHVVLREQSAPPGTSAQHARSTASPEVPVSVQSPTPAQGTAAGVRLTSATVPPAAACGEATVPPLPARKSMCGKLWLVRHGEMGHPGMIPFHNARVSPGGVGDHPERAGRGVHGVSDHCGVARRVA